MAAYLISVETSLPPYLYEFLVSSFLAVLIPVWVLYLPLLSKADTGPLWLACELHMIVSQAWKE